MMISDLMPNLAEIADELCLLRGMNADNPQHASAENQFHTGSFTEVRPSMGSWISYGLGSENQNLPSFITIHPKGVRTYGSAFLPAIHQGTALTIPLDSKSSPIANLKNASISEAVQRKRLDLTRRMNERLVDDLHGDTSMEGMIQNMELAFRMQTETPSLVDVSKESEETLKMYGVGGKDTDKNARACLLARRLSESPQALQPDRPAGCRSRQRFETARNARRHARTMVWRIRSYALEPGLERYSTDRYARSRASATKLLRLDGRRRNQARVYLRRDRPHGL